ARLLERGGALLVRASSARGLRRKINPGSTSGPTTRRGRRPIMGGMTTTDYLINAAFVLVVLRQARDRQVDLRSFLVPLFVVFLVARQYVHTVPVAGNDLALVGALAGVGLALGLASGFATRVRAATGGVAFARVGWP